MRTLPRAALRLGAFVLLAVLLVGVPLLVVITVGVPSPTLDQWRTVWTTGRVDSDFVVRLGAAVFALLWSWFATTALMELWRVFPRRHDLGEVDLRAPGGPSGWVQGLVRFVAVSSVTASAALGSFSVSTNQPTAQAASPAMPTAQSVVTSFGPAHVVVAGDSYWHIADQHLHAVLQREPSNAEVALLTGELVGANGPRLGHRDQTLIVPGELVVLPAEAVVPQGVPLPVPPAPGPEVAVSLEVQPEVDPVVDPVVEPEGASKVPGPEVAPPAPSAASSVRSAEESLSHTAGLGAAVLMSAGVLGAVEVRRRRRLRAGARGARPFAPSMEEVRVEVLLRSLSSSERVARLDVALRSVAKELASQRASVMAVELGEAGEVRLHLRGAAVPTEGPWQLDLHGGTWQLPAAVPLEALVASARECAHPCPALAHIGGVEDGGELFVDLEAVGVLSVRSPSAAAIVRGLAASMSISPFLEAGSVFTVGLGDAVLDESKGEEATSLVTAVSDAQLVVGATAAIARDVTTFALRGQGAGGEAWEPAVVFAVGVSDDEVEAVGLSNLSGGRGLGVVVDAVVDGAHRLSFDGVRHVYEPLGIGVRPIGFEESDVASVSSLVRAAEAPFEVSAPVVVLGEPTNGSVAFVEPEWTLLVKVLGQVEVTTRDGDVVRFERSKSLELAVWLSQHRERPTRSAARTALWDVAVRDATFANIVSDARRAMGRAVTPMRGEEWIARTLTEELPLHDCVLADADLLAARVSAARGLAAADAIEVLRPGLELVTGLPFSGTGFLWSDAEGHTSSLVLLATGAAIELAHHYLTLGDVDGVFWATGQGLKVLSGHEELIALRMRAHAHRGDLAGVRQEWESYERALAADPWAAAEPAAKLVNLRRELLSPMVRTGIAGA